MGRKEGMSIAGIQSRVEHCECGGAGDTHISLISVDCFYYNSLRKKRDGFT